MNVYVSWFLVLNALSCFLLAAKSKTEFTRNVMWIAAALFWIAAGIWRH